MKLYKFTIKWNRTIQYRGVPLKNPTVLKLEIIANTDKEAYALIPGKYVDTPVYIVSSSSTKLKPGIVKKNYFHPESWPSTVYN